MIRNKISEDRSHDSQQNDLSILVIKVYQKHRIGKDKLVGSLADTISEVLRKLKDGGKKTICVTCSIDAISTIKALEETLGRNTSDGTDSGITIKFSFAAESRKGVDAHELQATDAVAKATEAVGPLGSTPPAAGFLSSAVDTGTNVITEVQTFETTWGVLLQRMALFNRIVSDIAAVFDVRRFDSFIV